MSKLWEMKLQANWTILSHHQQQIHQLKQLTEQFTFMFMKMGPQPTTVQPIAQAVNSGKVNELTTITKSLPMHWDFCCRVLCLTPVIYPVAPPTLKEMKS